MSRGELIALWAQRSREALVADGWKKRTGQIYTRPLDADTFAWLGLSRATKYLPISIFPVIGVRHEPTMRLCETLTEVKRSVTPTLSTPIRYLTDDRKDLMIDEIAAVDTTVQEVMATVRGVGSEFVHALQDTDRQLEALAARRWLPVPEYAVRYRPAMLAVLRRPAEALSALDEELATLGDRADAAAVTHRLFGVALRRHLAE